MALNGTFDSRAVTTIVADNREYLKAVAQIRREEEKAERARDAAIARTLEKQGKLTEATFATAKAAVDAGGAFEGISKQTGIVGKAIDILGARVKATGMSMLAGLGAGIAGSLLGGSVTSIIQKAFAPPTDEDLRQMARASDEIRILGYDTAELARQELARRDSAARLADAQKNLNDVLEGITHADTLDSLNRQLADLEVRYQEGTVSVEAYTLAQKQLRDQVFENTLAPDGWGLPGETMGQRRDRLAREQKIAEDMVARLAEIADRTNARIADIRKAAADRATAERRALDEKIAREVRPRGFDAANAQNEEIGNLIGATTAGLGGDQGGLIDTSGLGPQPQKYLIEQNPVLGARNKLQQMFGTPDEMNLMMDALDGVSGAFGAMADAVISGSESAGAAFKKYLAGMLRSDAVHAAVQAVKEGAWALGSLALGDSKGAAMHGLAAAKWGTVAVLAGAGAFMLGGGGGGSGGGGGGGGGGGAGGGVYAGGGSGGGRDIIYVYGELGGDMSPRMMQARARRQLALAGVGGRDDVRYS